MNYFDKLPTIVYKNYTVKNILAKAQFTKKTQQNKSIYYPYNIKDYERVDHISNDYYDSPGYSWLVWMSNNTIDPYYDLALADDDFNSFIVSKYGTYQAASRKIRHFTNNYKSYPDRVSIDYYEALYGPFKKYYDPVVDAGYVTVAYSRKAYDDTVATNKMLALELVEAASFTVGEEVRVDVNNYAFVVSVSDTHVYVNHVVGALEATDSITGMESGTADTIIADTIISETIASDEAAYWTPVTYYEYEMQLNEDKKKINLIDVRQRNQAEAELERVLRST